MILRDVRLSDRCKPDCYKFCSRAPAKSTYSRGFRNAIGFGNRSVFSIIPSYDLNYNALFQPTHREIILWFCVTSSGICKLLMMKTFFLLTIHYPTNIYKWEKRTKLLLAFIYDSPRWHSNNSKTFRKLEKCIHIFVTILRLADTFKRWTGGLSRL